MSLREWLIIIGALVILGVLLDGVRRMLRARRDASEFSQGMGSSNIGDSPLEESFNPELPNGGSRVIEPGFDSGEEGIAPPPRQEREPTQYRPTRPITAAPKVPPLSADDQVTDNLSMGEVPVLSSVVKPSEDHKPPHESGDEPEEHLSGQTGIKGDVQSGVDDERQKETLAESFDSESNTGFTASPYERSERLSDSGSASPVDNLAQSAKTLWNKLRTSAQSVTQAGDRQSADQPSASSQSKRTQPQSASAEPAGDSEALGGKAPLAGANRPAAEEVIVINVHCKGEERFSGPALKRLFDGCGLEYGDMAIYHRHETPDTRSPVQFSVANAVSPGTFRPQEMTDMASPGISFFLSLPGPDDAMQAFEFMLETAQTVVRNLGGELRDEQRSVMTGQTIEHCRQCIREYERRRHFVRQH